MFGTEWARGISRGRERLSRLNDPQLKTQQMVKCDFRALEIREPYTK